MRDSIQLSIKKTNSFNLLKVICFIAVTFLCTYSAKAQNTNNISVKGAVFNKSDKTPLPGASIVLKNTLRGTETNFNGQFTLDNINIGDQITVHFMGFEKKEITITNNIKPLNIYLNEDGELLGTVNLGAADTGEHYKTKRGFFKTIFR